MSTIIFHNTIDYSDMGVAPLLGQATFQTITCHVMCHKCLMEAYNSTTNNISNIYKNRIERLQQKVDKENKSMQRGFDLPTRNEIRECRIDCAVLISLKIAKTEGVTAELDQNAARMLHDCAYIGYFLT